VPVVPAALSCPAATDARSKLLPLASCAANFNTAVDLYDLLLIAGAYDVRVCEQYTEFNSNTFIRYVVRTMSFRIINQNFLNHTHASRHSNDTDADS
jgi:hypothetical protein